MSAPLPSALRARFQRYIEDGLSGRAAAARLKLSPATGARWRHQIQMTGRADPAVQGRPKGSDKLAPHVGFFEELIAQDPDITLFELRDALAEATGLQVQHTLTANDRAGILKVEGPFRRIGARSFTAVFQAIGDICEMYSPQECSNYFQAAGYVSS